MSSWDWNGQYASYNNYGRQNVNPNGYFQDGYYAPYNNPYGQYNYYQQQQNFYDDQYRGNVPTLVYSNGNFGSTPNASWQDETQQDRQNRQNRHHRGRGQSTSYGAIPKMKPQKNQAKIRGQQKFNRTEENDEELHKNQKKHLKQSWRAKKDVDVAICQRERLIDQLNRGDLECLVCCERIRQADHVWSCSNCYHVLHLKCIIKWASSSKDDHGWRCPACQNISKEIPTDYVCMCGKYNNPEWIRGETPHCCGQLCGRKKDCPHGCTILCHPGPCPQCCANVNRQCGCGRTKSTVICSSTVAIVCEAKCEKALNCGSHLCQEKCHQGNCELCDRKIHQVCYCKREERDLLCDGSVIGPEFGGPTTYTCGKNCPKTLTCGSHPCPLICHAGDCPVCCLSPTILTKCPCGQTDIPAGSRKVCTDTVPLCRNVCNKELPCGPQDKKHKCKSRCHEGPCPPCEGSMSVRCRCGLMSKDITCKEFIANNGVTKCQKRCSKKRNCGKHKCNQLCCVDDDHVCPLPCNKSLKCGLHKCDKMCHKGLCSPCLAASFEELHCECGKSVILPPVPCGTRAPECNEPCTRSHVCGHPPMHSCHSFPECPPCSVLTSKYCFGGHELRKTVPCHMGEYSCGLACSRPLACGHKCNRVCHDGACLSEGQVCTQPCQEVRESGCGHPCAALCHPNRPCPANQPCLAKVQVSCECGRRTGNRTCSENSSEYKKAANSLLASKMANVRLGKSVQTEDIPAMAHNLSLKTLECNDECKLFERNLRLAIGLQIANPDLSMKLSPKYSDSLKAWVKKDRRFCEMVHEKLSQLVQLAKTSRQRSRSYSFQSMGSIKRQFIHEYCKHFGVESVAYDPEPNRNIVATAYKDKCWMPSYSLLEVVARESGHRKVPSLLPSLKKDITLKEPVAGLVSVKSILQPKQEEQQKES